MRIAPELAQSFLSFWSPATNALPCITWRTSEQRLVKGWAPAFAQPESQAYGAHLLEDFCA